MNAAASDSPRRADTPGTTPRGEDIGPSPARILVVDDQRVHRDKLVHAVRALGHDCEAVGGGASALARLAAEPFDLVLLDILMPDMDGFEVMSVMQRDRRLREIPVIVVSALESEMGSVVRAVEMGADDMLPKRFDRVLLAARLDSALERHRAHAHERELHRHMRRLTDAAGVLEHHPGLPASLRLEQTCRRDDEIGRLARVFVHMSDEIHARDVRLQRQLALLRLVGLALAAGAVLGLVTPLARAVLLERPHPFGIGLWVAGLCALMCLAAPLWRGELPRRGAGIGRLVLTLTATAALAGTLPLLWLATRLPASALAAVLPAEIAIAVALPSLFDGRRPSPSRLLALAFGAAAIGALGGGAFGSPPWSPATLALALLAPLGWALAARALAGPGAAKRAQTVDALALVGLVALLTAVCLVPLAIGFDELVPLFGAADAVPGTAAAATVGTPGGIGLVVVLLAAALAAGATLRVQLAREGGAEIAAASSFGTALAALGWSVMVLGERVPPALWLTLALFAAALLALGVTLRGLDLAPPRRPDVELD